MFPKIEGKPPKMDGFIMENPIKMDDLGGKTTPIFGNLQMEKLGTKKKATHFTKVLRLPVMPPSRVGALRFRESTKRTPIAEMQYGDVFNYYKNTMSHKPFRMLFKKIPCTVPPKKK